MYRKCISFPYMNSKLAALVIGKSMIYNNRFSYEETTLTCLNNSPK